MKNTNSNSQPTGTLQFTLAKVNPSLLQLDPLLSQMGFDNRPDEFFKTEMKSLGLTYERPIVDTDNNVLTHSADVIVAQEEGIDSLEVYVVALNEFQKRRLIAHKHRYNRNNLALSYETSMFFKSYLTENQEGILFAETIPGDTTRKKVAALLNTSDTTIKRLWYVGDYMPDEFGLITQNNSSLKEAEEKIKLKKWSKEQREAKKHEQEVAPAIGDNSTPGGDEKVSIHIVPINKSNEAVPFEQPLNKIQAASAKQTADEGLDEDYVEPAHESPIEDNQCQTTTIDKYDFSDASITIKGMGKFVMNVTDNVPQLTLNGKRFDNAKFLPVTNLNPQKFANVNSYVFQENSLKGLNVQIIISNFKN